MKLVTVNVCWGKTLDICSEKIVYIESADHKSMLHLWDGKLVVKEKLFELEEALNKDGFYRCHQSFLVNMKYVKEIRDNAVILENSIQVYLSRRKRKAFKMALADWKFG